MADSHFDQLPLVSGVRKSVEELANRAFRSSLTNLLNRPAYEALREVFADEETVCVAFLDLTGFKAINERYAYAGGNATLVRTGALWEGIANSIAGRAFHFSGDEFVMVFPAARLQDFETSFEAVLSSFTLRFEGQEIAARANAGIAVPEPGQGWSDLLKRAEAACKYGKSTGVVGVTQWSEAVVKRALVEVRWQCEACSAVTSVMVETSRSAPIHHCANCRTERATAAVA